MPLTWQMAVRSRPSASLFHEAARQPLMPAHYVAADGGVAEQHAAARLVGHGLQHVAGRAHRLHQAAPAGHHLADLHQLRRIGEGAGNGAAVRRLVRGEAVGREPDRALIDGLRHDVRHLLLLGVRRLVGKRPVAHHVVANGAVADHAGDVQARAQLLHRVQVVAVILPSPRQPGHDRLAWDVFDRLHHAGEKLAILRLARREGDAAIAHQRRGHTVPRDRREIGVPADLRIQMRVQVDEPRAITVRPSASISRLPLPAILPISRRCGAPFDADVGAGERPSRANAVDDLAAANNDVIGHGKVVLDLRKFWYGTASCFGWKYRARLIARA